MSSSYSQHDDISSTYFKMSDLNEDGVEISKFNEQDPPSNLLPFKKTPLPNYSVKPGFGTMPVEIFQEVCTCGRPLGSLSYKAGIARAKAGVYKKGSDVFVEFSREHNLQLCCRNSILEPTISFVVSSDINTYNDGVVIKRASPPSTIFDNIFPPTII